MVMDVREIPLYDAIVVSHLKDREGASEFIALLCDQCANFETQVVISDLADIRDQFPEKTNLGILKEAIQNCTCILVYVSKKYDESGSRYENFVDDFCQSSAIFDETKRDCLIPIWVDHDPFTENSKLSTLHIYTGWRYYKHKENLWYGLTKKLRGCVEYRLEKEKKKQELDKIRSQRKRLKKEIQLEVEKKEKLDEIAELERKLAKAKAAANEMSPHSERAPGDSLSQQVAASPTGVTVNINIASATLTESQDRLSNVDSKHRPPFPSSSTFSDCQTSSPEFAGSRLTDYGSPGNLTSSSGLSSAGCKRVNTETVGELTLNGVERLHLENCKNDPMVCESSKSKDDLRFALKSIHLENVDVGARTGNSGSILHSSGSSRSALVKRGSDESSALKDGVVVAYSTENSDRPAQARSAADGHAASQQQCDLSLTLVCFRLQPSQWQFITFSPFTDRAATLLKTLCCVSLWQLWCSVNQEKV
ncbi:hypothetical protein EB796_004063 [Bugula neritina]|uniref:TIR domain-containing protein n=1 Tax=Bugula neritina TaxID=10212 RepID=A0A7J7KJ46_BUGNE|nr:hypothetical protein EB796_004063 [Bugula neritina]